MVQGNGRQFFFFFVKAITGFAKVLLRQSVLRELGVNSKGFKRTLLQVVVSL